MPPSPIPLSYLQAERRGPGNPPAPLCPIAGAAVRIKRPVEASHNTSHRNSLALQRGIFSTPALNENTLVSDLGTGITGKAPPCPLRIFCGTVRPRFFRCAQAAADR